MLENTLDFLFNIIITVFAAFTLIEYLSIFLERSKNKVSIGFVWVLYFLWEFVLNKGEMEAVFRLLSSILFIGIISYVCFQGSLAKKTIFSISYTAIWMLFEVLIGYVFLIIGMDYKIPHEIGSLVSKVLLFLLVVGIRGFFRSQNIKELSQKYAILLMLIPIGSMYVMYTLFMSTGNHKNTGYISAWISAVVVLAVNILIFSIYKKLSEELELKRINTVYERQLEMCSLHEEEKANAMMEARNARHNMKQKLIYLIDLVEKEQNHEAVPLLEELIEDTDLDKVGLIHTTNTVVDSLVNYKYSVAKAHKIKFQAEVLVPVLMPFANGDLSVLLGNALDNSVEACLRMTSGEKYINLTMKYEQGLLVIVTKNSFDGKLVKGKESHLLTRKQDRGNHGIGVSTMRSIVEKYHGSLTFQTTDCEFILQLLLYAPY